MLTLDWVQLLLCLCYLQIVFSLTYPFLSNYSDLGCIIEVQVEKEKLHSSILDNKNILKQGGILLLPSPNITHATGNHNSNKLQMDIEYNAYYVLECGPLLQVITINS
jgi:hypothetical protein